MPPRRTRAANVAAKTTEEASTEEANEVDISVEGMTEKDETSTDEKAGHDDVVETTPITDIGTVDETVGTGSLTAVLGLTTETTEKIDNGETAQAAKIPDDIEEDDEMQEVIEVSDSILEDDEIQHVAEDQDNLDADDDMNDKIAADLKMEDTDINKEMTEADATEELKEKNDEEEEPKEKADEVLVTTEIKEEHKDESEMEETSGTSDTATKVEITDTSELAGVSSADVKQEVMEDDGIKQEGGRTKLKLWEPLPYPESFLKLRQLTVNIGPVKLEDLKSPDLQGILRLPDEFEMKFERKESTCKEPKRHKWQKTQKFEPMGFVKLPFNIRTPAFFLHIHKRLSTLNIDGRDMSVKFPDQFDGVLNDVTEYENTMMARRIQFQEKLKEEKAKEMAHSVKLENLPKTADAQTVKCLFPEAVNVVVRKTVRGNMSGYVTFKTREEAESCVENTKTVEINNQTVNLILGGKYIRGSIKDFVDNYYFSELQIREEFKRVNQSKKVKPLLTADEWNRSVVLENLPQSADEDTVKTSFPKAIKIFLNETRKGMRGHMLYESREEAKQAIEEKKFMYIGDQKVTQVLAEPDKVTHRKETAEEWNRSVVLQNLPRSTDEDTVKGLFPKALHIVLNKTSKGMRGYMVFKSRDEAQQSVQENRYVIIDGQKVTQVLADPDRAMHEKKLRPLLTAFIKIDFVADEWNRAVCLEQLPQSADEADVKEIFPKATKIHLTKTTKGMRGHMVFESREEARQSVREKKFVRIKDQRVTQVLAEPDKGVQEKKEKPVVPAADQLCRTIILENLPQSADKDTISALFPKATDIVLPKIARGMKGRGHVVFKSREEAMQCMREGRYVMVSEEKVTKVLAEPDKEMHGKKLKHIVTADEWNRAVCLENLPQSAEKDAVKALFPNALDIVLTKTAKGMRGHMVFESREEAKKVVQEKRHVKISDQKVTQVLAVREPGDGKKKNKAAGEGEGPGSGEAGPPAKKKFESSQDSSNKGGGQKQGSPRGPASNVMKERMARIRRETFERKMRMEQQRRGPGMAVGRMGGVAGGGVGGPMGGAAMVRPNLPPGNFFPPVDTQMMANFIQMQAQALAGSATPTMPKPFNQTMSPNTMPGRMRGSVNVQLSPNIGNQPQFGGGPLRQGGERLSPGGGGPPTSSEDDLWRKSNRKQKESSSASLPDDDDPAAMMAYLKSTLAKMEEKLNIKSQSQESESDRGDKRKMDLGDYGREEAKRIAGYSDYERETRTGTQSYGRQSDSDSYGGQPIGVLGQSSMNQRETYGGRGLDRPYFDSQTTTYGRSNVQASNYGNSGGQYGSYGTSGVQAGNYGTSNYGTSSYGNSNQVGSYGSQGYSGQGGSYGNQGYSGQFMGRY